MNDAEIRRFTTFYYQSPQPERAPEVLEHLLTSGGIVKPESNPAWYFFARVARDNSSLVRKYEALFDAIPSGRVFILRILGQAGDERTSQFLQDCLRNPRFRPLSHDIQALLQAWASRSLDPLHRPAQTTEDLDFLWAEFLITGNKEAVVRIVDVLEWPDKIRAKLAAWLHAKPSGRLLFFLLRPGRERIVRSLRDQADILCDQEQKEIVNAQDLDCYCSMDGPNRSPERFEKFAALLPFRLSEEDLNHVRVKSAAKWSLAGNAQQHRIVLDVCEAEAAKRINRSRIALLEISACAYLAAGDLAAAFNRLFDSLTPDPPQRGQLMATAEVDFERFLSLSTEQLSQEQDSHLTAAEAVARAVAATRAARTYRSKVLSGSVVWAVEHAKPDRFRVSQHAKCHGEDVYDDWVTIGKAHFRSPDYSRRRPELLTDVGRAALENELRLNWFFSADKYLKVLGGSHPTSIEVCRYGDRRYLLFTYKHLTVNQLALLSGGDQQGRLMFERAVQALLWVDFETGLLAKAQVGFQGPSDNGGSEQVEMVQVFASYNQPVSIVPPAFQLVEMQQA